jgi:hypothetical protein
MAAYTLSLGVCGSAAALPSPARADAGPALKRAAGLTDSARMEHHHLCSESDKPGCNCPCKGSRHGIRRGVFAGKAKRRLTDQITANVPGLAGKAQRTRAIRDVLAADAGAWLGTVVAGNARGAVIDELAEAIGDGLTVSGGRWRLREEHIVCEIYAQMHLFRSLLEQAVAVGIEKLTDQLIEIIAESLDDTVPNAAAVRAKFVDALRDKLTDMLAQRVVDVVLAHFGYPSSRQLAELICRRARIPPLLDIPRRPR